MLATADSIERQEFVTIDSRCPAVPLLPEGWDPDGADAVNLVANVLRGALAGTIATAAMDALWYRRYRADGGENDVVDLGVRDRGQRLRGGRAGAGAGRQADRRGRRGAAARIGRRR